MKLIYFLLITSVVASTEMCTCPESCSHKEELGRGTWNLLHSIVKHTEKTQDNELLFYDFMDILSQLYPCEECRRHFSDNLRAIDQMEMSESWMCEFHNVVNKQLGKPIHLCHE